MAAPARFAHISTKLSIPLAPPDLVARPALSQKLARSLARRLTLVAAPAGSGKTTLLSQWAQESRWPVAWVSLDAADNDPVRFWSYVVMALDGLEPSIGCHLLPMLHGPRPELGGLFEAMLINLAALIRDPFVLVLDDYHCIEAEAIHSALANLVDYLPPAMHVIISTRTEPPLPVARWRAQGHLGELRAADLRFSPREAEALLNESLGLDLAGPDVAGLEEWTEGWAAGLRLAAMAIEQRPEVRAGAVLPKLRQDGRYLSDYLTSEVLERQPELLRTFLLQTAILGTLNGPLCDAVTGRAGGQAALEQLYRRNLFITALDRKGHYRYHALFADFLRGRLQREPALDPPTLHMRAAAWYEQQGQIDEAIAHALAAGRPAEAARLMETTVRQRLMQGETATVLGWLRALPAAAIRSRPLFCLTYAWVLANSGQVEAAEGYLDHLEATPHAADEAALLLGEAATVRARIAVIRGEPARGTQHSERALALLPADAVELRSDAVLDVAFAHKDSQRFAGAEAAFLEAIALGRSANMRAATVAAYYLADTYLAQGRPQRAARVYQDALAWCRQATPPSALACWAHAGLGALLYEWGELAEAARHLRLAVELGARCGEAKILMYARMPLAHLLQTQGQAGPAQEVLEAAAEVAKQARIASMSSLVDLARVKLWLRQGQIEATAAWLRQRGVGIAGEVSTPEDLTVLAWLRLAQSQVGQPPGRAELARISGLLEARCSAEASAGLALARVNSLILLALARFAQGRREEAVRQMALACAAAEPMGLLRTFADSAHLGAGTLLQHVAAQQGASGYLERLLAALSEGQPAVTGAAVAAPPGQPPAEALHPREIEVLQHVALGRSNQEIADEMVLALSTVKWYLRNIYGKLGVSRRTQAVARARALGLLPPR